MIYVDSSALLKLVFAEAESVAFEEWLSGRPDTPLLSSELVKVEVLRTCRRVAPDVLPAARSLLAGVNLVPLSGAVVDDAGEVGDDLLRSLDALHLASALSVRESLSAFVAYDHRLAAAASHAGLDVLAPGS